MILALYLKRFLETIRISSTVLNWLTVTMWNSRGPAAGWVHVDFVVTAHGVFLIERVTRIQPHVFCWRAAT